MFVLNWSNSNASHGNVQNLQPQLIKTVGEVEALMVRIAKEKAEVVQPKAAAVAVDEAAAQAKVHFDCLIYTSQVQQLQEACAAERCCQTDAVCLSESVHLPRYSACAFEAFLPVFNGCPETVCKQILMLELPAGSCHS